MRIASLLFVLLWLCPVWAQEKRTETQPREQKKIPTTLAEAHAELERTLSPEELARIDAMASERDMIQYHMGLGAGIRNSWGLWSGGPLAKHMQELGFTHPDNMSGVILATFWCKRHGEDFRLEEKAANSKRSMEIARELQEEEASRVRKGNAAIQNMMMGLRFEKRDVPVVRIPTQRGLSVRFMCPFRGGVFLAAYCQGRMRQGPVVTEGYYVDPASGEVRRRPEVDGDVARGFYYGADGESRKMKPGDDFYTLGFHLDLKDRRIHRICVAEVNEVYAVVVAGDRAWFAGLTNGKAVLVGVGARDRVTVPLPLEDEIPDLGLDGQSLLAVYAKTIYRLTERNWQLVHSGDILLPRSGLPPQRHGNMVFLRDEGRMETHKSLWWLTMGEQLHLRLLASDTGLFEPIVRSSPQSTEIRLIGPPDWGDASSYCVTSNGDLWACVANGSFLLRRSKDGRYSIAIANNSVQFREETIDRKKADRGLRVSAITALPDDSLLLAGLTGLYRLKGNELVQELAFARGETTNDSGRAVRDWGWDLTNVLQLDDQSYLIGSDSWGAVYLIRKGDDGQWSCLPVDDSRETVVW